MGKQGLGRNVYINNQKDLLETYCKDITNNAKKNSNK